MTSQMSARGQTCQGDGKGRAAPGHPAPSPTPTSPPPNAEVTLRLHRTGWQNGFRIGFEAGRAAEAFERDLAWKEMAGPVIRNHGLLERRWTLRGEPRTRATFGLPHPADFKGGAR